MKCFDLKKMSITQWIDIFQLYDIAKACGMVWMFVSPTPCPPNLYAEILMPHVMILGSGALEGA